MDMNKSFYGAVALSLLLVAPTFAEAPESPAHITTAAAPAGQLTPEQAAVYWHAKYLVAQQQLLTANDQVNSCPTYLQQAVAGARPAGPAAETPPK